jgi:hypothetical protein
MNHAEDSVDTVLPQPIREVEDAVVVVVSLLSIATRQASQ